MAKKVIGNIKLQIPAGKATPAPPVGPALGQHGVNIMGFCKEFNAKTADQAGLIIPVVISVYQDRSFSFITKTPPAAVLIKKACKIESGSGEPNRKKVAKLTKGQLKEIAELKSANEIQDQFGTFVVELVNEFSIVQRVRLRTSHFKVTCFRN